ncbi:ribonucleotide reductase stimulatory protein [Ochrobactrum phage vB_OspM_OC]|nr:ribonucleotide reductase stimulatory protein [Ochrobactrum phage vB_OspM_OC]
MLICYFSSKTGNTLRFANKLDIPLKRIELGATVDEPFVLFSPTYADGCGNHPVPPQIIKFLNNVDNRSKMLGVVGFGNRSFGRMFAIGSTVIANKCNVPILGKVELFGNDDDVLYVREKIINVY